MSIKVTLHDWVSPPGDFRTRCPRFRIETDDARYFLVLLNMDGSLTARLANYLGLEESADVGVDPTIDRTLLRFGVRRIEQALASGELDGVASSTVHQMFVHDDDLELLREFANAKTCDYQVGEARELYCSAASPNDETRIGSSGLRHLAPTSEPVCLRCNLPDTDYICSHLVHPRVYTLAVGMMGLTTSIPARQVEVGACNLGQPEIREPQKCHAGGNSCWERLIEHSSPSVGEIVPPQSLAEAFDHLDTTWRLAYGRPLLRLRSAADVMGLALPCGSREDFESRVSDLDDLIKNWALDDDLLPSGTDFPSTATLARVESILGVNATAEEVEELRGALESLRAINRVRVGYQHAGASQELPTAFSRLGIDTPSLNWGDTWDRVRTIATRALRTMATVVRRIAIDRNTT